MALVCKPFGDIITFSRPSGATWFNSAGNLIGVDFSTSSNTIGTGSKTFTLTATAGVDRSWATGDSVLISDQSNSANNMTGTVTSYTASTQVLVVNVTSTGGSGTIASWRVGSTMPRLDYNPSTLAAQGLLIEEQRTNSIRNNTMQGAVAGTPGTLPTNWSVFTAVTGLTREIVGTGTENGVTYIDIKVSGTPSAAGDYGIYLDTATGIAAATGQTWTQSAFLKTAAGSQTGISSITFRVDENTSGGVFVTNKTSSALSVTSTFTRFNAAFTLNGGATVACVFPWVRLALSGAAIDITLRIGLPQLEQGSTPTSVIPTTTTALTRSADVESVNTLSPWYNSVAGTLYVEIVRQSTTGFPGRARFSDGTANNAIDLYYDAASNSSTFEIKSGGSPSVQIYGGGGALNTVVKAAAAWETNNAAVVYDGAVQGTDTSVVVPSGINQLRLANALTGYIRRVTYYPRRLSNAELQAITA